MKNKTVRPHLQQRPQVLGDGEDPWVPTAETGPRGLSLRCRKGWASRALGQVEMKLGCGRACPWGQRGQWPRGSGESRASSWKQSVAAVLLQLSPSGDGAVLVHLQPRPHRQGARSGPLTHAGSWSGPRLPDGKALGPSRHVGSASQSGPCRGFCPGGSAVPAGQVPRPLQLHPVLLPFLTKVVTRAALNFSGNRGFAS